MSEELLKEGRHGGDTIDGLMTRAENAGNKAVELLDAALMVLEEGEAEEAQNLFLQAANYYLEANNCYVQASMTDHANSRALAKLAGEMFISAQKANETALDIYRRNNREHLELMGTVPNGYADTFAQEGEPDEIEVWDVVATKSAESVKKGDFLGHPFRGNQYSEGAGEAKSTIEDIQRNGLRRKDDEDRQWASMERLGELADSHRTMAAWHEKQADEAYARHDDGYTLKAHRDAALMHERAADKADEAYGIVDFHDRMGDMSPENEAWAANNEWRLEGMPDPYDIEREALKSSNTALRSTGRAIEQDLSLTTTKSVGEIEEAVEVPSNLNFALELNKQAVTAFSEGKLAKSADFMESVATHLARSGEKELAKSVFGVAVELREVARDMRASGAGVLTKSVDEVRTAYAEVAMEFHNTQTGILALNSNQTAEINEEVGA